MNPTVIIGLIVAVGGPILVSFGFSDSCSSEITAKGAELVPAAIGGIMALVSHKNSVGSLRKQVSSMGAIPHA